MERGLVAIRHAVLITGAPYETIRRLCAAGVIFATKRGTRWMIPRTELARITALLDAEEAA